MSLLTIPSRYSLRVLGWEVSDRPIERKFVGLAWPHTSNLDGFLLVMMAAQMGLTISWMVKDAVNQPVLGDVVRRVGGVFIDRSQHTNVVGHMVHEFKHRDDFALMIPPEGTRSRSDYWKSGFYHIACDAGVPIIPAYLDYSQKRGGFGPPITPTGDVKRDMDAIRAFYAPIHAKGYHADQVGPIRLREEEH